jgi:hypothetical protein
MNTQAKTMVWRTTGPVIVVRQSDKTPLDHEWDGFLRDVVSSREKYGQAKILIVTDGGGPSSDQRTRLKKALDGKPVRSAVVSDSSKVRFIASAIMLINRDHGSYARSELPKALEHLMLNAEEQRSATALVAQLETEMSSRLPA